MATNKVKFSMTLEKLSFTFEGDSDKGQQIQQGISRTLGDLAKLQHQASGSEYPPEQKQITGSVIETKPLKRRRSRKSAAPGGAEAEPSEGEASADETGSRRTSGVSIKQLVLDLKKQGFFGQPRTTVQLRDEVNTKGHTHVRDNHLTAPLKRLCIAEILKRTQNENGVWQYQDGPKNE